LRGQIAIGAAIGGAQARNNPDRLLQALVPFCWPSHRRVGAARS